MRRVWPAGLMLLLWGCGAPSLPTQPGKLTTENGATQWVLDGVALAELGEGEGALRPVDAGQTVFELPAVQAAARFDRVGLRWDQRVPGDSSVDIQVRTGTSRTALGGWESVHVVYDEAGMVNAYLDVPADSKALSLRLKMFAPSIDVVPEVSFAVVEMFEMVAPEDAGPAPSGELEESVAAPSIVSRAEWGASAPTCSIGTHTPYRGTFHHTETPNGETGQTARNRVKSIQNYHQHVRGWCDIGYHLLVDAAGQLYRGRAYTSLRGAHVGGQNTGNVGIAYMGSFTNGNQPSSTQMNGMAEGFAWVADYWGFPADSTHIRGHQEWPGQSTDCPGASLDLKSALLAQVNDIIDGVEPPPPDDPGDDDVIVVDNESPWFHASDNWGFSDWSDQRYQSDYRYRVPESTSDLATWGADLPSSGSYEVWVWYTSHPTRTSNAPYFVYHDGGTSLVHINQQADGGKWVSLGTYSFSEGLADRVGLSCWTSGSHVIADAIKMQKK